MGKGSPPFLRVARGLLLPGFAWLGASALCAAEAPAVLQTLPAPLTDVDREAGRRATVEHLLSLEAAHEAIKAGFHRVAETTLRALLSRDDLTAERRRDLTLALTTTLIAQRKTDEAAAVLEAVPELRAPAWELRRAAVAYQRREYASMERVIRDLRPAGLSPADRGWYHFLWALFWHHDREPDRAEAAMEEAIATATSEAERAFFRLGRLQAQFGAQPPSEALVAELQREIEDSRGRPTSFRYVLQLAVALDGLGRSQEAIEVLEAQREQVPPHEPELHDQTLLLLGIIAGPQSSAGREALGEFLLHGADREFQRAAILHLASGLAAEPGVTNNPIRDLLESTMRERPQHPLTDHMLLVRSRLAFRNRNYAEAEELADALLTRFPGSELRPQALALLVNASWRRQRYRTTADYITRLRAALAATPAEEPQSRRLAVLLGECFFRAGLEPQGTAEDFRNAAEAYGLAQAALPPDISGGEIFFQRVMSWIRGDAIENAIALLDSAEASSVDAESRWQAEWNLARVLHIRDRGAEAFARVQSLSQLDEVSAELRLRFMWLAARLSLSIENPDATVARIERLREIIAGAEGEELTQDLLARVASNSVLLEAQALLETGNPEAGLSLIEQMQAGEYADTPAGIFSYIVRGRYLAAENRLVEAQQQLTTLADRFPESEYAPQALFEAALVAMRRGQDAYLRDADELLNRIFTQYGSDEPLLFSVLLKQGDIQRELNQFGYAEQLYSYLENYYPDHPDQVLAQLSLADTLLAQAPNDPAKSDAAISRLERLTGLPSAPVDLRIEAGFKLGFAWQNRRAPDPDRAAQVYWQLYTRFLQDEDGAAELGAKGRYWIARALLELGQLEESAGRLDQARRSFEAVLIHELPAAALARGFIARLGNDG